MKKTNFLSLAFLAVLSFSTLAHADFVDNDLIGATIKMKSIPSNSDRALALEGKYFLNTALASRFRSFCAVGSMTSEGNYGVWKRIPLQAGDKYKIVQALRYGDKDVLLTGVHLNIEKKEFSEVTISCTSVGLISTETLDLSLLNRIGSGIDSEATPGVFKIEDTDNNDKLTLEESKELRRFLRVQKMIYLRDSN